MSSEERQRQMAERAGPARYQPASTGINVGATPLEDWCGGVMARMHEGRQVGDDVAVLAVEVASRVPA